MLSEAGSVGYGNIDEHHTSTTSSPCIDKLSRARISGREDGLQDIPLTNSNSELFGDSVYSLPESICTRSSSQSTASRLPDHEQKILAAEGFVTKEDENVLRFKGWSKLSKILREHDENKIRNCKEDMDTLLVFAGLFSAVLTAFVIDSYKNLQPDAASVSVSILLQISQQLTALASQPVNQIPVATAPPFQHSNTAVQLNILWFSSLVCSLVTASLGILIKQWLREYIVHDSLSPRDYVRVRHFRYDGLIRYKVFEIAALLPLLLHLSLLLFFIGLRVFLSQLDSLLSLVVSGLILAWILLFGVTTIAPILSPSCPYKTPLLKGTLSRLHKYIHLWQLYPRSFFYYLLGRPSKLPTEEALSRRVTFLASCGNIFVTLASSLKHSTLDLYSDLKYGVKSLITQMIPFGLYECYIVTRSESSITSENSVRLDSLRDVPALVATDQYFMDDSLLFTMEKCLSDVSLPDTLDCLRHIIQHRMVMKVKWLGGLWYKRHLFPRRRAEYVAPTPLTQAHLHKLRRITLKALMRYLDELGDLKSDDYPLHYIMGMTMTQSLDEAIGFLYTPLIGFKETGMEAELGYTFVRLLELDILTACRLVSQLCFVQDQRTILPKLTLTSDIAIRNLLSATSEHLEHATMRRPEAPPELQDTILEAEDIKPSILLQILLNFFSQTHPSLLRQHSQVIVELISRFTPAIEQEHAIFTTETSHTYRGIDVDALLPFLSKSSELIRNPYIISQCEGLLEMLQHMPNNPSVAYQNKFRLTC